MLGRDHAILFGRKTWGVLLVLEVLPSWEVLQTLEVLPMWAVRPVWEVPPIWESAHERTRTRTRNAIGRERESTREADTKIRGVLELAATLTLETQDKPQQRWRGTENGPQHTHV